MDNNKASYSDIYGDSTPTIEYGQNLALKSVLVTGSQGMLGNGLAKTLQFLRDSGVYPTLEIHLASRSWERDQELAWQKSKVNTITLDQISSLREISHVIHASSPSNITQIDRYDQLKYANLTVAEQAIQLNPSKMIYISSSEVFRGDSTSRHVSSQDFNKLNKRDWYPLSKIETENYLLEVSKKSDIDIDIVRLFHTFGPGVRKEDGRSFADFLWGAATRGEVKLKSNGEQKRTFLYLSDAIDGILKLLLSSGPNFRTINIGSSEEISILDFAALVCKVSKAEIYFEKDLEFLHSPNNSIIPDTDEISDLGWVPRVRLQQAVELTYSWIIDSIAVNSSLK